MISCDDATLISDKKQYKSATSWELLKMSIHVLMCKNCKVYTVQNDLLTQAMEQEPLSVKQVDVALTAEEKEQMKKTIEKEK